jgi:hypothetical protein
MGEYWFRPKERGIGAGIPLNWKGWALFGAYLAALLTIPTILDFLFGYEPELPIRLLAVALLSGPFLYVAWLKTEGGWHFRRNEDD